MKSLPARVFLVFSISVLLLSSCVDNASIEIVAYCDHVDLAFVDDGNGGSSYVTIRTEDDHRAAHEYVSIDATGSSHPGSLSIALDDDYPDGTLFRVYRSVDENEDGTYVGEDTCSLNGHHIRRGTQWFEPGDSRLNRQAYAYAAIYCDADNQRVGIYGIHSQATDGEAPGKGFPAIFVPYTALPPIPTPEQGNSLIQQYANVGFYRLTSGEYQVNAGPDNEGKTYVVVFDGCPNTYMHAYMMQNGVMTPSEVYPR